MSKSIQQIKIKPSLLEQMTINNNRILSQISVMNDNPTAYTGEALKHALCVIAWHSDEQNALIKTLQGHIHHLNKLIDKADEILTAENAFTAQSYDVLNRQDERLATNIGGNND